MKRVMTVQDISCVGKCSLTVALPIISAFGVETAILPTAVLSTHTAFTGFTFRDLTSDLNPIINHWEKEGISFDALYSGYLGSYEQIQIVANLFKKFKTPNNFVLVDPAMADNGNLYKGFDREFALNMASLCKNADIIVPNLTEASFMLDIPYTESYDEKYVKQLLQKLTNLGCKKAVLTGVTLNKKDVGVYAYDSDNDTYFSYMRELLPQSFHGTGDVFASALTGALSIGKSFEQSLKLAVDFTVLSIDLTIKNPQHNWYGVDFESAFPMLIDAIK